MEEVSSDNDGNIAAMAKKCWTSSSKENTNGSESIIKNRNAYPGC